MRLIANLEYIIAVYYLVEPRGGCLQIVESVSHVTLCSKNDGFKTIL
jgi:hypothetical protein